MQLSRNSLITLTVLALVGLGVVFYIANPNLFKRSNTATNSAQTTPKEEAISAESQGISESITISKVDISKAEGGFVIVSKLMPDGVTAEISVANSDFLTQGRHENVKIGYYPLKDRGNTELKVGDKLVAYIVIDDGNKVYDQGDTPSKSVMITLK
jgi:hypothetical protein